jgi:hypothetical protein
MRRLEISARAAHRLALGGQPATPARHGNMVALREPEHLGHVLRTLEPGLIPSALPPGRMITAALPLERFIEAAIRNSERLIQ